MRLGFTVLICALSLPLASGLPLLDQAPWGSWKKESVFPGDVTFGSQTFVVVGGDGVVHTAFTTSSPDGTWLSAYYSRSAPLGWETTEVAFRAAPIGLALDSAGVAHVVTVAQTGARDLRYWTVSDAGMSSELVHTFPSGHSTWSGHLVFDDLDRPHILENALNDDGTYFTRSGGVWSSSLVNGNMIDGDIAVLGSDVHVLFDPVSGSGMRHAVSVSGGAWTTTAISGCEASISLAAGPSGALHVACFADGLAYQRWDGANWEREFVDSKPLRADQTAIAVDALDQPHIAYRVRGISDSTEEPMQPLYATKADSAWNFDSADRGSVWAGFDPSIAMDASGRPHIIYGQDRIARAMSQFTGDTARMVDRGIMHVTPVTSALGNLV